MARHLRGQAGEMGRSCEPAISCSGAYAQSVSRLSRCSNKTILPPCTGCSASPMSPKIRMQSGPAQKASRT
jgi:hypothetical protein